MDERRRQERHSKVFPAEVRDGARGRIVGLVADVSTGGMLVRAETPQPAGERLRLIVELPTRDGQREQVAIEAQVRWCEPDLDPGTHVIGLAFAGKTPADGPIARSLVQNLRASG
jgi:hypothetical protein